LIALTLSARIYVRPFCKLKNIPFCWMWNLVSNKDIYEKTVLVWQQFIIVSGVQAYLESIKKTRVSPRRCRTILFGLLHQFLLGRGGGGVWTRGKFLNYFKGAFRDSENCLSGNKAYTETSMISRLPYLKINASKHKVSCSTASPQTFFRLLMQSFPRVSEGEVSCSENTFYSQILL